MPTNTPPTDDDLHALFQIQADIENARENLNDTDARLELVINRLDQDVPDPEPCPPSAPRAVGVGGSGAFAGLTRARRQEYLALAKAAGVTDFRFSVNWSQIEATKGQYKLDGVVALAKDIVAAGLRPMALVGWTPPHYRPAGTTAGSNAAPDPAKGGLLAWGKFLAALLPALTAAGVWRIEVWNEPNFQFMQPVSPAIWAALVRIAHEVASTVSRGIVIISGGLCPAVDTPPRSMGASAFMDAVLVADPLFFDHVNEVGIHPYAGNHTHLLDGQFWTKHATYLRSIVPARIPLTGTEHGWKSTSHPEPERIDLYLDSIASFPDTRSPLYIFSLFDFADGAYGLLDATGKPKGLYYALREYLT